MNGRMSAVITEGLSKQKVPKNCNYWWNHGYEMNDAHFPSHDALREKVELL